MRKNEAAEDGGHEGICGALLEKAVDPELKAAVKRERCAENLVLAEDQEKKPYTDAQHRKRVVVASAGI